MRRNKIYCTYCGEKNLTSDLKCKKCHKKLNIKEHALLNYLKNHIKDDLKGNVEDNVKSILIIYIKSHLYGTILTCSLITTAISVIITSPIVNQGYIENVTKKPTIVQNYTYQGIGLSSSEVVDKYIEAIKNNKEEIYLGLQLDTFYPELESKLVDQTKDSPNHPFETYNQKHNLLDNKNILFKPSDITINTFSHDIRPNSDYNTYTYEATIKYCSYDNCSLPDGDSEFSESGNFHYSVYIQVIEVDGNFYIFGDVEAISMSVTEELGRKALFNLNGDIKNFSYSNAVRKFDACVNESSSHNSDCLNSAGLY